MKFDKAQISVLIVGVVILLAWDPVCKYMGWFQVPVETPKQTAPAQPQNVSAPKSLPAAEAAKQKTAAAPGKDAVQIKKLRGVAPMPAVEVGNADLKLIVAPVSASVLDFIVPGYKTADRKEKIRLAQNLRPSLTFTRVTADPFAAVPVVISVKTEKKENALLITRRLQYPDGGIIRMEHRWSLDAKGGNIDCKLLVINESALPRSFNGYGFAGASLSSWAKVSGDSVRTPSHRLDYMTAKGKFKDVDADDDEEDINAPNGTLVEWAGVSNKYFCILLSGAEPFSLKTNRIFMVDSKNSIPLAGCSAEVAPFILNKGERREFNFKAYAGPKIISELEKFNPSAGRVMHLAWGPLDYLARLLLWILVKIHALGLSYGWSIIVLTLIVRILFYPATAKANSSMKKMQQVQPKLKEIKEQYKDNPQLMNAKMMELYRTEGVNPFGGCLPLLLQLPVFIALYTTLDGAVELRQVPFWWSPDLAGPDTVCHIPLYFYDLPVNPLVIIMTVLMVIQQHITPMGGDPMQKKMMMWMPVVMLLLFYDLPSGLTLYWSVSNIFSIIQLLIQKRNSKEGSAPAPAK